MGEFGLKMQSYVLSALRFSITIYQLGDIRGKLKKRRGEGLGSS